MTGQYTHKILDFSIIVSTGNPATPITGVIGLTKFRGHRSRPGVQAKWRAVSGYRFTWIPKALLLRPDWGKEISAKEYAKR